MQNILRKSGDGCKLVRLSHGMIAPAFPFIRKAAFSSIKDLTEVGYKNLLEEIMRGITGVFYLVFGGDAYAIAIGGLVIDRYTQELCFDLKAFMSLKKMDKAKFEQAAEAILFFCETIGVKRVFTNASKRGHENAILRISGAKKKTVLEVLL